MALIINGVEVQTLRLASLDEQDEITVKSVNYEINDDTFVGRGIGICSYTWGHEKQDWSDPETGLTWRISSKAKSMCLSALEYFKEVWIDGLCIVQTDDRHKKANMAIMGKLYYHGICCPELIIGMSEVYFHRGWVQQEISFTYMKISSSILKSFFARNKKMMEHYKVHGKQELYSNFGLGDVKRLFRDLKPTFRFLLRIICGRETDDDKVQKLSKFYSLDVAIDRSEIKLDNFAIIDGNMYGDYTKEVRSTKESYYKDVCELFEMIPDAVWEQSRETNKDHIRYGAVVSYSTGFFSWNTDRINACFSLASYVLEKQDEDELLNELNTYKFPRELVLKRKATVIANPGRYCTGYEPICALQTLPIIPLVDNFIRIINKNSIVNKTESFDTHRPYTDRHNLDVMFSVIYGTTTEKLQNYEYVMGYKTEENSEKIVSQEIRSMLGRKLPLIFQILGLKPKCEGPVAGLVLEYSKKARFTHFGGSHKNRWRQDSDTQHLDALRVLVETSWKLHKLRESDEKREVNMIMEATRKACKFLDYAFSYLYNFDVVEFLEERGDLETAKDDRQFYNKAKNSIHTDLRREDVEEWRKQTRKTVSKCDWGHESWEHFEF